MNNLSRRNFMRLAAVSGAALAAGTGGSRSAFAGSINLQEGGRDFSPATGKERQKEKAGANQV